MIKKLRISFYFLIVFLSLNAHSIGMVPGGCGTLCMANNRSTMVQYPNSCVSPYSTNYNPQLSNPWSQNPYSNYGAYGSYTSCFNCSNTGWYNSGPNYYRGNTGQTWQR